MTVKEFIEILKKLGPNLLVVIHEECYEIYDESEANEKLIDKNGNVPLEPDSFEVGHYYPNGKNKKPIDALIL